MTTYLLTVSHPECVKPKSTVAFISEANIESLYKSSKYDLKMEEIYLSPGKALTYKEALIWLKSVKLHKMADELFSTMRSGTLLPKEVSYDNGVIKVETSPFKEHTIETCHKEIELMNWIIKTFPNAKYHKSRNTFYIGESWTVKDKDFTINSKIISYNYEDHSISIEDTIYKSKLVVL